MLYPVRLARLPALALLALAAVGRPAPAPARMATDVCGPIAADTVWAAAASPFRTTCDVDVAAGVTLTIEPSVVVQLGTNHAINVAGALKAVGRPDARVRFEPSGAQPWGGIQLAAGSGPSEIGYAELTKGGGRRREMLGIASDDALVHHSELSDSAGSGIEVKDGASPTIRDSRFIRASDINAVPPAALRIRGQSDVVVENCYFESNNQYGVSWEADASPRFVGNRFEYNAFNGVMVFGNVTRAVTWPGLGPHRWAYHLIRGTITVDAGGHLTIKPGATFSVAPATGIRVRSGGTLSIRGAAGAKVRMTTNQLVPSPGQWREIEFEPGSVGWDEATQTGSIVDHAELEYGGSQPGGTILIRSSSPRISNTVIRHSGKRGMTVTGPGAQPLLVGNLFDENVNNPDGTGLFVGGTAAPEVRFNIFRANLEGVHVDGGAQPRVGPHNWFDYNQTFAVVNADASTCVDATGNDWGGELGPRDPSTTPDACGLGAHEGDGELVSDHVRVEPFEGRIVRPSLTGPRCGTFSDGRVTITGFAAAGSRVQIYDNYALLGETTAAAGAGSAPFTHTLTTPLSPGSHVLQVRSELDDKSSGIANPIELTVDPGLVVDPSRLSVSHERDGTRFIQPFQDESGCLTLRGDAEWNIRAHPGGPITLHAPVRCAVGALSQVQAIYRDQTIPLELAEPGGDMHRATFEMGEGGTLRLQAMCGDSLHDLLLGTVTVEQNGFIYNKLGTPDPFAARVSGARVSLYVRDRSRPGGQDWVLWPAARYFGQTNPQTTGGAGWYAFYPPPGQYRVRVEAPGYVTAIDTGDNISIEPIVRTIGLTPLATPTPPSASPRRAFLPLLVLREALRP